MSVAAQPPFGQHELAVSSEVEDTPVERVEVGLAPNGAHARALFLLAVPASTVAGTDEIE